VSVSLPRVVAGALGFVVVAVAGWALIADDPFGGEPMAVVPANLRADAAVKKSEEASLRAPVQGAAEALNQGGPPAATVSSLRPPLRVARPSPSSMGPAAKRQDVVILGSPDTAAFDERLTESSRHGPLPKVAQDGARPADVYARPVKGIPGNRTRQGWRS